MSTITNPTSAAYAAQVYRAGHEILH